MAPPCADIYAFPMADDLIALTDAMTRVNQTHREYLRVKAEHIRARADLAATLRRISANPPQTPDRLARVQKAPNLRLAEPRALVQRG